MRETISTESDAREHEPLAPGLYLVATPIGNLEDMTLRGLRVLRGVDRIACEDTRQTQKLLNHFQIRTPTVSYHRHNEVGRAAELVEELKAGARIAVVSDAGTPGIADPGAEIAEAAIAAGVVVYPIPGANAALSALVASGLAGGEDELGAFAFRGFLPAKEGQRRTALDALRAEAAGGGVAAGPQIFYEAPHRIVATLEDVEAVFGAEQHVVLARELTKLHEEFLRGPVGDVRKELAERAAVRGEFVLVMRPRVGGGHAISGAATLAEEVRAVMKGEGLDEKDALKRVAKARGMGKSEAYREWQRTK
ncbi:MAG TPA: 16S rRNA (cytidine(1402)-2'-O)-methyltransferase [Acidobacteriaceae bacterium]|nr:16S rRNA (cytidine(1402)-2'-O)-methyltransferase [Acidobacteriaceae bacterium]